MLGGFLGPRTRRRARVGWGSSACSPIAWPKRLTQRGIRSNLTLSGMTTPTANHSLAAIRVKPTGHYRPRLAKRFKLVLYDYQSHQDLISCSAYLIDCDSHAASRYVHRMIATVANGLDGVRLKPPDAEKPAEDESPTG